MSNYKYYIPIFCTYIFFVSLTIVFIANSSQPFPIGDSWRFLKHIIEPLFENNANYSILWNNPHQVPLKAFIMYLNALFFGINYDLEVYLGVAAKIIYCSTLIIYLVKTNHGLVNRIPLICLTIVAFSFNNFNQYTWSILTLSHLHYLLMFIFFIGIDIYLRTEEKISTTQISLIFFITFAFIVSVRDLAIISFAAVIIYLIFFSIITKKIDKSFTIFS